MIHFTKFIPVIVLQYSSMSLIIYKPIHIYTDLKKFQYILGKIAFLIKKN